MSENKNGYHVHKNPGKRILWYSNAPYAPTGYGNQTGLMCAHLPQHGHEMAVLANYGLSGTKLNIGGVKIYPNGRAQHSNDIVQAMADDFEADVIVTLYDAWPLSFATLPGPHTPWVAWAPVDHETVPPPVVESLQKAQAVVAYSRHGQQALKEAGIDAHYIPHGVDTNLFNPGDGAEAQAAARKEIGFPAEAFVIGMVAANTGYPSRKCIPEALAAFAEFQADHPEALLYLHMRTDASNQGVDVNAIIKSLGLTRSVLLCDQFQLQLGYPAGYMANLYRAFDVLLNPSRGEGFGIPILESLACGTPVIATDTTAMTELVEDCGWLVEGEPFWSAQGAWQKVPKVEEIVRALENAWSVKFGPSTWREELQRQCVERAQLYDFASVVAPMWDMYLRSEPWLPKPVRVSVITPWRDHPELIPLYERSVQGADEVIIVDNASAPETADLLEAMAARLGGRYVPQSENLWFSQACNLGASEATGEVLVFLNNDIAAKPGWLNQVRTEVKAGGLFGPSLAGCPIGKFDIPGGDVPYLEGWCLAVHTETWFELDGFDEDAYPLPYYEDADLAFRAAEMGAKLVQTSWPVIHLGSMTTGFEPGAFDGVKANHATFMARVNEARKGIPNIKLGNVHEHEWQRTGLFVDGKLCVPCKEPSCSAGLIDALNAPYVVAGFFPLASNGIGMDIDDDPEGGVAKIVCKEIELSYRLDEIPFEPDNVVLDIGAHVGIVSIYLAKKYPELKILAFEPMPENYQRLVRNLRVNSIENVYPINKALTGDGRFVSMEGSFHQNSGGMTVLNSNGNASLPSITLQNIFEEYELDRVRLVKIDCEGAEYETLGATPELLNKVDYLRGEFHVFQDHDPRELLDMCGQYIPDENIRVSISKIEIREDEYARRSL